MDEKEVKKVVWSPPREPGVRMSTFMEYGISEGELKHEIRTLKKKGAEIGKLLDAANARALLAESELARIKKYLKEMFNVDWN